MEIGFKKILSQLLFWIYDFIDTVGTLFNIFTGTQKVNENGKTLLEVFVDSAISTKVLLGLAVVTVIIAGACVGVKTVKNVIKLKAGGEASSHSATVGQGFIAVLSSVVCIFFVVLFISFSSMLLNMVNTTLSKGNSLTLSQNLFSLSVEQSYVLDESEVKERYTDYYDEYGELVQDTDANGELLWETNENGEAVKKYKQVTEYYYDYMTVKDENGEPVKDENGNTVYVTETGWCKKSKDVEGNTILYTADDITWSMSPDQVFGVHKKNMLGLEQEDKGYTVQPMVRLDSFNLFTAYLVAVVMVISMFLLSVGLVKRIYDIVVLVICMPLVCGTIPLDDGARFRAWRETFMSKVLVAFGAVIAINVFYMLGTYIMGPQFGMVVRYLTDEGVLNAVSAVIFKMLLLLGGALCINGCQVLIARIMGTSADESREAMQTLATITSGVRLGAAGLLGAGRLAFGAAGKTKRALFGGQNRYGRETTGVANYAARLGYKIGEKKGDDEYTGSKRAAFARWAGRMGKDESSGTRGMRQNGKNSGFSQPNSINSPQSASRSASTDNNNKMHDVAAGGNKKNNDAGTYNDNGGKR